MPRTRIQTAREPSPIPTDAVRHEETIETREDTPQPTETSSSTLSTAPDEFDETTALIRATQLRIAQLEELAELRKKEEELLKQIQGGKPREGTPRTRRNSEDSNSSSGKEVRVRNITKLTLPTTFQKRDAWLSDLNRAFTGARRRYRKDYKKILTAMDNMDAEGRGRWDRYVDELPEIEREAVEENWEAFKEWSLSLIKDSANREPLLMKQLENAQQRDNQSPQEFHQYLDSIEKNFPRPSERQRALVFYAKLLPSLQDHISLHSPEIPNTREGVVTLATRFWDSMRGRTKRRIDDDSQSRVSKSQKRHSSRERKHHRYPQDLLPTRSQSPYTPKTNWQPRAAGQKNPTDTAGKTLTCYKCGSDEHFAPSCQKSIGAGDQNLRVEKAFEISCLIHGRKTLEIRAILDSGAEADSIKEQFAISQGLKPIQTTRPTFCTVGGMELKVLQTWLVPITLTDRNGRTRRVTRTCIGVEGDPKDEGNPLLLSESTLVDLHIITDHARREWWFRHNWEQSKILTPRRFERECRNKARIFAITQIENSEVIPDEDDTGEQGNTEVPPEFREFIDVFSSEKASGIPEYKNTDHRIDLLPGKSPPYGPIYPLSQLELKELRQYLDDNLASGRIRPSKSPAGAPILFVPKKDGSLRLCVDYRGLNGASVKNRYPLPLVTEILDRIQGAKFFSKIDVKDAYHRIRIAEGDEWKTAFRTRYGHFEYVVMPFGLTNAPATFQHYIHEALRGLVDTICIVYLDDILIFSKTREEHTEHVRVILERMRQAELYAKPSKCTFFQDKVEYLGYILSSEGISMDPTRVETIRNWKEPETYREIQVFLGFCNFYRRFIQGYSGIARPLTALTQGSKNGKKPGSVCLNEKERISFRTLIEAFQKAPLLRHFDPNLHIRIETDASAFAMAGILSQPDPQGKWHPIAFWSRKFKKEELSYGTPDHELFAIVESFKHWRHYLEGALHQVEVLSDHYNLQTFMKNPKLNGRQARWCLYLTPYDFIIRHRAGKTNPADAPSRKPEYEGETPPNQELLPGLQAKLAKIQAITRSKRQQPPQGEPTPLEDNSKEDSREEPEDQTNPSRWKEWVSNKVIQQDTLSQLQAKETVQHEETIAPGTSGSLLEAIQTLQQKDKETKARKAELSDKNTHQKGIEWSVGTDGLLRFKNRLFIPHDPALRNELLRIYHDDPLAGHFGIHRTLHLLQRKLHWVGIEKDVRDYIQTCAVCQGAITPRHKPYGRLESLPIPQRPMAELSMDFITGLPPVIQQGKYVDSILVIVDRFTKYCFFFPVSKEIGASELATLFHEEIELRYGPPEGIVSDRGSVFTSAFWSELCYASRVIRRLSTAFHPQTDGQTERMNQILEHYLRCFISADQVNWASLLRSAEFACNNADSATTGVSPFKALLGFNADFQFRHEAVTTGGEVPEVNLRITKLQNLREQMKIQWRSATEAQAKHYNSKHQEKTLSRGDLVGLSTKNIKFKGEKKKLVPRFIGPFCILERVGRQAYRLALPQKYERLHNVFHISLLEPWQKRPGDTGEVLPMPDLKEDNQEWEVESISDQRRIEGSMHYLVKWKGWPHEYDQWVNEEDMGNAPNPIRAFLKRKEAQQGKLQPKPAKPRGRPRKTVTK
ncbi:gag polymerase env poly [Fusarium beomiforme]|uniref:Gag polymerase env poly n=1 Tax=Fusarium beomiforme TaxID=44412 RepID=A0A9P5A5V1_9HYPO|nr:gag polymerase env poly [Fusarium beomiforme]